MNKKEQAEVLALHHQIALLKAWRLTEDVKPDVPPPAIYGDYTTGILATTCRDGYRIEPAASDCSSHFTGQINIDRIREGKPPQYGSQSARQLYSKRSNALRHCRYVMEQAALKQLAAIDIEITKAEVEE